MSWIKVNLSLRNNPKLVTVASQISVTRCAALGAICHAWMVADEHADEHGIVKFMTPEMLDGLCECPGLTSAMAKVGWLTILDGSLQFPEYQSHNGTTGKARASASQRKQKQRHADVTKSCDKSVTRREEKRGEEKREEQTHDSSSAVGKPPSEIVGWTFESGWTGITEKTRARWIAAFPACSIDSELAKMDAWLHSNPAKARKSRWERFATGWLTKAQDSGGSGKGANAECDGSIPRYSTDYATESQWLEYQVRRKAWMAKNNVEPIAK